MKKMESILEKELSKNIFITVSEILKVMKEQDLNIVPATFVAQFLKNNKIKNIKPNPRFYLIFREDFINVISGRKKKKDDIEIFKEKYKEKNYFTLKDLEEIFKLSFVALKKFRNKEKLKEVKFGKNIIIYYEDLVSFLEKNYQKNLN